MATVPTIFDHHVQVGGKMRKLVGIWVRVGGKWRPVVDGWSRIEGAWRPWVHTTGGGGQPPVHPPTTVHLKTITGHRSGSHWTFALAPYKGRIVSAQLQLHVRTMWQGTASGYPSGGTLASFNVTHAPAWQSRTVSSAVFNAHTTGVTLHTISGTTAAVDHVRLKIRYK